MKLTATSKIVRGQAVHIIESAGKVRPKGRGDSADGIANHLILKGDKVEFDPNRNTEDVLVKGVDLEARVDINFTTDEPVEPVEIDDED